MTDRKLAALLLAFVLVVTLVPASRSAADAIPGASPGGQMTGTRWLPSEAPDYRDGERSKGLTAMTRPVPRPTVDHVPEVSPAPLHIERNHHAPDPSPSQTPRPQARQSPISRPQRSTGPVGGSGGVQTGIAAVVRTGLASTYGPSFSEHWVALPEGPGWRFRVCGVGGCRELVSTDAGPDLAMQRQNRIVDLPVGAFEVVCGVSWRMGLCNVSLTILGRVR